MQFIRMLMFCLEDWRTGPPGLPLATPLVSGLLGLQSGLMLYLTDVKTFFTFFLNFQNSFTGTLCGQVAITSLLHIAPHRKCALHYLVSCEISMKYAYITIITNKHFGKIGKKYFRPTLQYMVCVTLNCVDLTQSSVIRNIHRNVGLKCFFIYLNFCYCH